MSSLEKKNRINYLAPICLTIALFLTWRWWKVFLCVCCGWVLSDVPMHVELALAGQDYSLASVIVKILYSFGNEAFAQRGLAVILTGNNLLGLLTLAVFLRYLLPGLGRFEALLAAELASICGPWLIPGYQMGIYMEAHNGNLYHNMTVLFSRSFVPVTLMFFMQCWADRHGRIRRGPWLGFMLSFLLTTAFKSSFAMAFVPVVAALLLYDFIRYKGRYFKNEFIIGCAVLPAGLLCIWQYLVIFDESYGAQVYESVEGQPEETGVALRLLWGAELIAMLIMYLRSLLLPVYSLVLQGRREPERGRLGLLLAVELVALAESSFLVETGYRANHGNFEWGGLAMYQLVFGAAIAMLFRMLHEADRRRPLDVIKCAVGIILLLGHLAVGLYFIYYFNSGGSYFI